MLRIAERQERERKMSWESRETVDGSLRVMVVEKTCRIAEKQRLNITENV